MYILGGLPLRYKLSGKRKMKIILSFKTNKQKQKCRYKFVQIDKWGEGVIPVSSAPLAFSRNVHTMLFQSTHTPKSKETTTSPSLPPPHPNSQFLPAP